MLLGRVHSVQMNECGHRMQMGQFFRPVNTLPSRNYCSGR